MKKIPAMTTKEHLQLADLVGRKLNIHPSNHYFYGRGWLDHNDFLAISLGFKNFHYN